MDYVIQQLHWFKWVERKRASNTAVVDHWLEAYKGEGMKLRVICEFECGCQQDACGNITRADPR